MASNIDNLFEQFASGQVQTSKPDYTQSVNTSTVLKDPRFLTDLRDFYEARGLKVDNDDDLIDKFYSDNTWADSNTVSAAVGNFGLATSATAGEDQRARMGRIRRVWEQLPFFWQEGGRGWSALPEYLIAGAADPTNLIGAGAAAKVGMAAGRKALVEGTSKTALDAAMAGARAAAPGAALTEGAVSAGQGALQSVFEQNRDTNLGLQDGFSFGKLAVDTATGGAIGAAAGGVVGGAVGGFNALRGAGEASDLMARGLSPEQVGSLNETELARFREDPNATFDSVRPAEPPPAEPAAPALTPEQQVKAVAAADQRDADLRLNSYVTALRQKYDELQAQVAEEKNADKAGEMRERIADLEAEMLRGRKLVEMGDRLSAEEAEINQLRASNDPAAQRTGDQRGLIFERDLSEFRRLASSDVPDSTAIDSWLDQKRLEAAERAKAQAEAAEAAPAEGAPAGEAAPQAAAEAPPATAPHIPPADVTPAPDVPVDTGEGPLVVTVAPKRRGKAAADTTPEAAPEATPGAPAEAPKAVVRAEPDVRAWAFEKGVDLFKLTGSGPDGAITRQDVTRAARRAKDGDPDFIATRDGYSAALKDLTTRFPKEAVDQLTGNDAFMAEWFRQHPKTAPHFDRVNDLHQFFSTVIRNEPVSENIDKTIYATTGRQGGSTTGNFLGRVQSILRSGRVFNEGTADEYSIVGSAPRTGETRKASQVGDVPTKASMGMEEARAIGLDYDRLKRRYEEAVSKREKAEARGTDPNRVEALRATEASVLKSLEGRGPVVPFAANTTLTSVEGGTIRKGDTAYMESRSGRVFSDPANAYRSRGEVMPPGFGSKSQPATQDASPWQNDFADALAKFLENRDLDAFVARTSALTNPQPKPAEAPKAEVPKRGRPPKEPEPEVVDEPDDIVPPAPTTRETRDPDVSADFTPPLVRGDMKIVLHKKGSPLDYRAPSDKQIANGASILNIISRSDKIGDYEWRYVPRDVPPTRYALRDAFASASPAQVSPDVQRVAATPVKELGATTIPITDLSAAEVQALVFAKKLVAQSSQATRYYRFLTTDIGDSLNGNQLFGLIKAIEVSNSLGKGFDFGNPKTASLAADFIDTMAQLHHMMDRFAPNGILFPADDRKTATNKLLTLLRGRAPETVEAARQMMARLAGDSMPIFEGGARNDTGWAINTYNDGRMTVHVGRGDVVNQPDIASLYHEVAHWAYNAILAPADRAAFWEAMRKYYSPTGERMADRSPTIETPNGRVGPANGLETAQEFFANQFSMWAMQKRAPADAQAEVFWRRMATYVKAVFDRYFSKEAIDPELEPLFAKILPDDERTPREVRQVNSATNKALGLDNPRLLDHVEPEKRSLAQVYQFHHNLVKDLQAKWSEAGDDPSSLLSVARETAEYIVQAVPDPKFGKAAASGKPNVWFPYRKLYKLARDRLVDINTILKDGYPESVLRTDGSTGFVNDSGIRLSVDEARAEMLRDLFDFGHGGAYKGSRSEKPRGTSLDELLGMMLDRNERGFAYYIDRPTPSEAVPPSLKPQRASRPETAEVGDKSISEGDVVRDKPGKGNRATEARVIGVTTGADGRQVAILDGGSVIDADSAASVSVSQSKRGQKTKAASGARDTRRKATAVANTGAAETAAKAVRTAVTIEKPAAVTNPKPDAPSLRSKDFFDLVEEMNASKDEARRAQLAGEVLAKAKATSISVPNVPVPEPFMQMTMANLEGAFQMASINGDVLGMHQAAREIWRRQTNKTLAAQKMPTIKPVFTKVVRAIQSEIMENIGVSADPSIPASARPVVRDVLSHIVHRDPQIERGARTIAHRLLNLAGKTERDATNGNLLTVADFERITGSPSGRDELAYDLRDPSFGNFRRVVRQIAASLENGGDSPDETMGRLVKTVSRVALDDQGRSALEGAHARAKAADAGTPDFEDWLAERIVAHSSGRAPLSEIFVADTGAIRSVSSLETEKQAVRNLVDAVAFVSNGVVGRADIRNKFPRITFYGDMFKMESSSPLTSAVRSQVAASPDYASGWASALVADMPPSRAEAIARWAGRGIGENGRPLWTTRSSGFFFDRKVNPDAPFSLRETGDFGPGLYVFENPVEAAHHDGLGSLDDALAAVRNAPFNERQADRISDNLERVFELRSMIGDLHARHARAADPASLDNAADLRARIVNLVAQEQAALQAMALDGFGHMPLAAPVFVRAQNMARLTPTVSYPRDGSFIGAITRNAVENSVWTTAEADAFMRALPDTVPGNLAYDAVTRVAAARGLPVEAAKTEANRILAMAGYEGLTVRNRNDANVHVLFDGDAARHVSASAFDEMPVLPAETPTNVKPIGVITEAIAASDPKKADLSRLPLFGEIADQITSDKGLVSAITSLARGRKLNAEERTAVIRNTSAIQLATNSERHRKIGMNWVADWLETYTPSVNERLGHLLYGVAQRDGKVVSHGLVDILRELPDGQSWGKRWFSAVTMGAAGKQPASYSKITKAMRYGPASRHVSLLTPEEAKVYGALRSSFADAYDRMKQAGVMVGFRRDYFPQVWSPDAIRKDPERFRAGLESYFQLEAARNGRTITPDEIADLSQSIYIKLTEEGADGLLVQRVGSTRNVTSDHIDYNRLIELDQHPEALPALEPFLENDLEAMLVKYHHGVERRIQQTQKFGVSNHGYYDYIKTVQGGEKAIADLLTTRRIQKKDARVLTEDGMVETIELSEDFPMPFENRYDEAMNAASEAVRLFNEQGAPAAREFLMSVGIKDMRTGKPSLPYEKRVDAIVGALKDYGGEPQLIAGREYAFSEKSIQAMMGKPLYSEEGSALAQLGRGVRAFNAMSLLSWTVLTSIPDIALPAIRSGSMQSAFRGWQRFLNDPDYKRMIRSVGSSVESIVNDRMAVLYGGNVTKATNAFFNATMLTPWTDLQRQVATATGYEAFKTMQIKAQRAYQEGVPLAEQNREFRMAYRFLQRYGLGRYATEAVSLSDESLLVNDKALRLGLIRFADEAIFAPNPNDVPLWAQTPIGALIWQFKSYPMMMGRMTKQIVRDAKAGDPRSLALLTTLGPAAGMGALAVKDVVQARGGEDERSAALRSRNISKWLGYDEDVHGNENDFLGWYVEGLMTMGGLGLLADLAHSAATNLDNGAFGQQRILSTIFGPSYGTAIGAMNVGAGILDTSDSNAKERQAVRELVGRVPGLGGVAAVREGVVEAIAGEKQTREKKGGWGSGGWG